MKGHYIFSALLGIGLLLQGCETLDYTPADQLNDKTFWRTEQHANQAAVALYAAMKAGWAFGRDFTFDMISDIADGTSPHAGIARGTSFSSGDASVQNTWQYLYEVVHRSNTVIRNVSAMDIDETVKTRVIGEAKFLRAMAYFRMLNCWGGVPYYDESCIIEEEFATLSNPRESAETIRGHILDDLTDAISKLPVAWETSDYGRATKGAAYAFKARIAIYNEDYAAAATAAKNCMDLNVYKLHSNYQDLFTASWSDEWIFFFRGDVTLKKYYWAASDVLNSISRLSGGWGGQKAPSYELVCAYPCIDGKPIDESPLYNPKDFFENRDPRMAMTIVPFATAYNKSVLDGTYDPNDYEWLGYEYSPSPVKTTVQRISDGAQVGNNDSKARAEHASYTGLLFKKYVDESFLENGKAGAPTTYPMLRYGDVLLMYAEAMNETNQCSQEVLDATINKLRERAYNGTGLEYPRVTEGSQQQLRTVIRTERFIEMAWEGHRYSDLIRYNLFSLINDF